MNCDAAVIVSTDPYISLPSRSKDSAQSGIHHTVDKLCVLVKNGDECSLLTLIFKLSKIDKGQRHWNEAIFLF